MRKSIIIIFFTLLIACSMRLSVSEIEDDLGPTLINDIAEYANLNKSDIFLNSFDSKSPAKKPLVGKQKNLPDALKKKILDSPAKMKKAAMKIKKESMAMLKKSTMMMKKASAMKMKMKKK